MLCLKIHYMLCCIGCMFYTAKYVFSYGDIMWQVQYIYGDDDYKISAYNSSICKNDDSNYLVLLYSNMTVCYDVYLDEYE